LLDVTGVVLEARPRSSEGDAPISAVVQQRPVDEFGAVVTVQAQDAKRQLGPQPLQRMENSLTALVAQPGAGHPAGCHVDHAQRVQELPGAAPKRATPQWNGRSEIELGFLVENGGFEPPTPCLPGKGGPCFSS
jgi:hypothetical protein